jgi:hypothetical protein
MLHSGCKTLRAGGEVHTPGPDDLRLIETYAGRALAPEEIYARAMVLCTGEYDRDHERFSDEVLAKFAESIVGKSLLVGHRRDAAPEGLFYRAEVIQRPSRAPAVKAWFYMLVTPENEHLRKLMDGGVVRYTSIGFRCEKLICDLCGRDVYSHECPHIPGRQYDGRTATGTWQGEAEAVEGSLVYLGSQREAMLTKAWEGEDGKAMDADARAKLLETLEETRMELAAREADVARLEPLAADGERFREELKGDIRALCALAGDRHTWEIHKNRLDGMDAGKLLELRESLRPRAEAPWVARRGGSVCEPDVSAYVTR